MPRLRNPPSYAYLLLYTDTVENCFVKNHLRLNVSSELMKQLIQNNNIFNLFANFIGIFRRIFSKYLLGACLLKILSNLRIYFYE